MAEKTGPGPSRDSSSPPGKSSSFEMSLSYSSATSWSNCAQHILIHHDTLFFMQFMFDLSLKTFCPCLWVGAVQFRIYLLKCFDRRQIQGFSDLSVTPQAKVSSSLDGHGHQISPGEPQRSVHVVYQGTRKSRGCSILTLISIKEWHVERFRLWIQQINNLSGPPQQHCLLSLQSGKPCPWGGRLRPGLSSHWFSADKKTKHYWILYQNLLSRRLLTEIILLLFKANIIRDCYGETVCGDKHIG